MKLANMHIFLENYDENTVLAFHQAFLEVKNHGAYEVSLSPVREYGSYGELYATLNIDETRLSELLAFMSDAWDGPEDDCQTTSFTSHVFHESINTLYFTLFDD